MIEPAPMTGSAIENGEYPEDWREQGWCCRECAVQSGSKSGNSVSTMCIVMLQAC